CGQYSTDELLAAKGKGRSLLRKLYESWRSLQGTGRPVELRLLSNWSWAPDDALRQVIRGRDNALSKRFFTAPPQSKIGQARERWQSHLAISDAELRAFAGTLRFRTGFDCSEELERRMAERMMLLGLRDDRAALLTGVGIVRRLIQER